jgi:hypothetical protein
MNNTSDPQPSLVLSHEELRALLAVVSLNWSKSYVADAEQAIGDALGIDTANARPILDGLIRRKRLEPRSLGANNLLETSHVAQMRCKWFLTPNPYDTMRANVAEILKYEANLPSTEYDFKAVVTKDGAFYCHPVNRVGGGVPSEECIFHRPAVGPLTEATILKRILDTEEDDIRERGEQASAGMVETDHWTNW